MDALVRAVPAGNMAKVAANAFLLVDARHDFVVKVQMLPLGHAAKRKPAKILDGIEALFAHPVVKALGHVFNDAIAVVHGGSAYLYGPAAEENKLCGIAPRTDAA